MTPPGIETRLRDRATALGFTLFGIAPATDADGFGRFCDWLDRGYAGEMAYLHEYREERRHPSSVVESVRSVVMLGLEYGKRDARHETRDTRDGRVAAYARGPDYHRFIWDRVNELSAWLMAEVPGSYAHGVADTAPILERDFARRAGLGWSGKNTMLINKHRGSFFFLSAFLTDLELTPNQPHTASHCGTCTACLDACPTRAFPEPSVLDATKCISYLTIELRGSIPENLREPMGDWLFGCDVCQDVCPWNVRSPLPLVGEGQGVRGSPFPVQPDLVALNPVELLGLSKAEFKRRFQHTSLWRAKRTGLLRNAAIVLGNTGDERALPALERATTDEDEVIREAATWALTRVRQRYSVTPT
ncbi:MAG: tRNA epoxyqueuosine(34) reductase QueG [Gemmataceae bacterium]